MDNEREVNEARRDNRVLTVDAKRHQEIQVVDWVICSAPQNENEQKKTNKERKSADIPTDE